MQLPGDADRDALQIALKERGIPTMVYYPKPMHEQRAFEGAHLRPGGCPVAKRLCETVLSLPMGPYLDETDLATVSHSLISLLSELS